MTGVILRLRPDRGFGFIKGEDEQEFFFHRSKCDQTSPFENLREGDHVKFRIEDHEKGKRAVEVTLQ